MLHLRSHTQTRGTRWRLLLLFCLACGFSALPLEAGFIGDYAVPNFTLVNTLANGSAMTPDGGLTLVLTGPNTGSDLAGTTDFTIAALGAGLVQFNYLYTSLDTPGWDYAGYLLGNTFVQLADTDGQSGGPIQFAVNAGDVFGFRVGSLDNTGEPGIFTISSFSAPPGTAPPTGVPEPGTLSLFIVAGAAVLARGSRARIAAWRKEQNV